MTQPERCPQLGNCKTPGVAHSQPHFKLPRCEDWHAEPAAPGEPTQLCDQKWEWGLCGLPLHHAPPCAPIAPASAPQLAVDSCAWNIWQETAAADGTLEIIKGWLRIYAGSQVSAAQEEIARLKLEKVEDCRLVAQLRSDLAGLREQLAESKTAWLGAEEQLEVVEAQLKQRKRKIYAWPDAPKACPECNGTIFISSGADHLTCYICFLTEQNDKAEAELAGLREALKKYGRHLPTCDRNAPLPKHLETSTMTRYKCTCGFQAALGGETPG